jgi:IS5 family transposase
MPRRRIGQETFGFEARDTVSALDDLRDLLDWSPIEAALEALPVARRGEAGWPPVALFRALLIAVWHDLSDMKLADAIEDRASFRRFCGFSRFEPTPERTAFVRFRRALVAHGLDADLPPSLSALTLTPPPCAARRADNAMRHRRVGCWRWRPFTRAGRAARRRRSAG